ncbi:MAG: mechanosensitive ion channel family protein [Polyangiaceae bacterium]|nr:mechanosensitive ion channel family protein [Polyangiaceae bacterium]
MAPAPLALRFLAFRRLAPRFPAFALVLAVLALPATAHAQPAGTAPAPSSSAGGVEVAPDSPRASLERFLERCGAGQFEEAARHLELWRQDQAEGAELARRLKAVLDRHAAVDVETVSPLATGEVGDGLAPHADRIGTVRTPAEDQPVTMVRRGAQGFPWVFEHSTVQHINDWYAQLDNRWLIDRLPRPLLRAGPYGIPYWQWLGMALVALVALALGWVLGRFTRGVARWLAARTPSLWDDRVVARLGGPFTIGWALFVMWLGALQLGLPPTAERAVGAVLRMSAMLAALWLVFRTLDVTRERMQKARWASARPAMRSLLPLAGRIGKVVLVAIGAIVVVSELGYSPTSIVAGLGIGGLALALAAQKTVENLFGAFSIGVDQPLREGDYVSAGGFGGTVERIGLRSTRIRTQDRTVVSIPNGKLAEMSIESYALRDRFRLHTTLALTRATSSRQMRALCARIEELLRARENVWPDELYVGFARLGEASLDLEVMAWFKAESLAAWTALKGELLLELLEAVEEVGAALAYPTRLVQLGDAPLAKVELAG